MQLTEQHRLNQIAKNLLRTAKEMVEEDGPAQAATLIDHAIEILDMANEQQGPAR